MVRTSVNCTSAHGRANRLRVIGKDREMNAGGEGSRKAVEVDLLHALNRLDDIRPGLALDVEQYGRLIALPWRWKSRRPAGLFSMPSSTFATSCSRTGAPIAVSENDGFEVLRLENLIV